MLAFHLPTRWVSLYARISSWLFGAVVAGWLTLLMLWLVVHWFIVPRIENFRPWLEEQATLRLGHPVVIGKIEALSHGLVPEFRVDNIRLLDTQGQTQLALNRVTLSLTPTSLLQGEFSQIALDDLDLDVVRDEQGQVWVAGLPVSASGDDRLRNWVFSQWEWVLRQGRVTWTDRLQGTAPVRWSNLEAVLRNGLREHRFRMDATPDAAWGDRISLRGRFRQPLLSGQPGLWEHWSGQAYLEASRLNLAPWQQWWPGLTQQVQGHGWLRSWLDIQDGQLKLWTTDAQFSDLEVPIQQAQAQASAWSAKQVKGRLTWSAGAAEKWLLQNAELWPVHGPVWTTKQATLALHRDEQGAVTAGSGSVDQVELASLQDWVSLVSPPLVPAWRQAAPQGRLQQVQWRWTGALDSFELQDWQAKLSDVAWQSAASSKKEPKAAWPGMSGVSADLSGHALKLNGELRVKAGQLSWPGVWEGPAHKINQFKGVIEADFNAGGRMVRVKSGQLLLDQARADFDLNWSNSTTDPLGHLDLHGDVPQASVAQIMRWLPQTLPDSVRQYVKQGITQGEARQIKARVSGRLAEFPFDKTGSGEFKIGGQLSKVRFQTLPRSFMDGKTKGDWPVLQDLSGELVFDRNSMRLNQAKAKLALAPNIQWTTLEAQIKQLDQAVVEVKAEGKGSLADALTVWKGTPLHDMTDRVMEGARATGQAEYRMTLSIPVDRSEETQAKGSVTWQGNEVTMAPGAPTLSRLRGALLFTESGFDLSNVQAVLWGGDVRLEGGTKGLSGPQAPTARIKAQGHLTANGLRDAPELNDWSPHLKKLQGSTQYAAQLQWRRGKLESQVSSDLVGLAIQAPAGLGKKASDALALRWDSSLSAETPGSAGLLQEQTLLRLGPALEARYLRDLSGAQPRVMRGLIRWGTQASSNLPAQGVVLRVQSDAFNMDEWSDWMQPFTGQPGQGGGWDFAPQRLEFQAAQVTAQGRQLNQVSLQASRTGNDWQGQVRTRELEGDVLYAPTRGSEPARLQARLARLTVPANANTDADHWLDHPLQELPTLDIQIRDLDLKGKKLGSMELLAQNRLRNDGLREWQLSKLLISNEDGSFQADGLWRKLAGGGASQTALDFKLTLKNAGSMLQRLGLADAIRNGNGSLSGKVTWNGSPVAPAVNSMNGQFKLDIERGQFLKTEPGAARLLGVLSLQSLPRRLMLDFRDVFSEGFAFDFFRGDVKVEQGLASSQNLQMKGVNVAVLMEGQANIAQETQDIKVLVIPDINAGGASLIYSTINPVVGLTTFLAQYVLRRPLMESATQQFQIDGSWSEPRVTQVPFKPEPKP